MNAKQQTQDPAASKAGGEEAGQSHSGRPSKFGPVITSGDLFQKGREVVITHDGQTYYLRITRQNKLILTK